MVFNLTMECPPRGPTSVAGKGDSERNLNAAENRGGMATVIDLNSVALYRIPWPSAQTQADQISTREGNRVQCSSLGGGCIGRKQLDTIPQRIHGKKWAAGTKEVEGGIRLRRLPIVELGVATA